MTEPFSGDYQILLISTSGEQLDLIDMGRVQSLEYNRIINDIGYCTITLSGDDPAVAYRNQLDMLIEIYRRNKPSTEGGVFQKEATYFNRLQNVFEDESNQEWCIIGGVSLEDILQTRIIVVQDDPTGAGGYSSKAGYADVVMSEFVDNQFVHPAVNAIRIAPQFTIAPTHNLGLPNVFERVTNDNVFEIIQRIAFSSKIDFEVVRTTGANLRFQCRVIGTDRTKDTNYPTMPYVLYDPKRGNMRVPNLTVDRRGEITFVYVQGQGPEEDREVLPVSGDTISDSIWNRREAVADARNNEEGDTDGMIAAGMDFLRQNGIKVDFTFEPVLDAPQGRYNRDFFLGDWVTGSYQGYTKDQRINEIRITVNSDGETIEPVLQEESI